MDADLAICDLREERAVNHEQLHSSQDFSPFDGRKLTGWVSKTILQGEVVYEDGAVVGEPRGQYLARPC
jgi:allantoinase